MVLTMSAIGQSVILLYLSLGCSLMLCVILGITKILNRPRHILGRTSYLSEENLTHTTRGCLLSALFFLPMLKPFIDPSYLLTTGVLYTAFVVPLLTGQFSTRIVYLGLKRKLLRTFVKWIRSVTPLISETVRLCSKMSARFVKLFLSSTELQNMVSRVFFSYICCILDGEFQSDRFMFQFHLYLILKSSELLHSTEWPNIFRRNGDLRCLTPSKSAELANAAIGTSLIINGFRRVLDSFVDDTRLSLLQYTYFVLTETNFNASPEKEHASIRKLKEQRIEVLQELESLWVPSVLKLFPILLSSGVILMALITSGETYTLALLVPLGIFFNIYFPLNDLCKEYWRPLLQELQILNGAFPSPTKEALENYGNECPICMDSMSAASRVLKCGHIFHSFCIVKCLKIYASCPVCRRRVI